MPPVNDTALRHRISGEARREVILAAAIEVFARLGYDATTVRAIANAAGVTTPVIYDHFSSKRDLHVELLEAEGDALIAHAARYFESRSAQELIQQQFDAFFAFVEERPYAWRMLFRELPGDPQIAEAHRRVQRRASEAIAASLALTPAFHLSAPLERDRGLELLAEITKSVLNGLASWWWEHAAVPREHIVATALDVLWTGIERLRVEEPPAFGDQEEKEGVR